MFTIESTRGKFGFRFMKPNHILAST